MINNFNNLKAILKSYIDITPTGEGDMYATAPCPLHKETSKKSLTFSVPQQTFYCFTCHKAGTVAELIMECKALRPDAKAIGNLWKSTISLIKMQLIKAEKANNNEKVKQLIVVFEAIKKLISMKA
jgi:hypothetical protein